MNYKVIALLMVCIVMAAAGCTALSGDNGKSSAAREGAAYASDSGSWGGENVAYSKSAAAPAAAPVPAPSGYGGIETKIIKTAYITIEVKDVTGSVESLKAMAAAKGGYLSSTNIQKNYRNQLSGSVVMRVPQAEFENTLAGIKAVGTVKSASTQGEDVTEEYTDLQAQKTSYQNQLTQYNAIMKQCTKVEDIIAVQEQIDRVQTELDRLEGRLKYLNSRVDFSTITVTLEEPEPVGGETGHNFVTTINEGIAGFLGMIDAMIIIFFTLLPLAVVCGAGYWLYRWNRRRNPAPAAPEQKKENQ